MFFFKVVIVLTACLPWLYCKADRYCCPDCTEHTMCRYSGEGRSCVDGGDSGVSDDEIKEILDAHNWCRRRVASGRETRGVEGGQPKAANMRKMMWDEDLAEVAQTWADQCTFKHDTCRDDPRFPVGQNIAWRSQSGVHRVNWTRAVMDWYSEVSKYNGKEVEAYAFSSATGHYTQVVWHDTCYVGCGRKDYGPNKMYVCNYGPAGNVMGKQMYTIGEPCSQCPNGTFCEKDLCSSRGSINAEYSIFQVILLLVISLQIFYMVP